MKKTIYSVLIYAILASLPLYFLGAPALLKYISSQKEMISVFRYLPYIAFLSIAFLGIRLNQTRVFFSSLLFLSFYHLSTFSSFNQFFELSSLTFFKAVLFSLPLCLTALCLTKESPLGGNKSLIRLFIGIAPSVTMLFLGVNDKDLFRLIVDFKMITSIDSYIIAMFIFAASAILISDSKIGSFKLSSAFALVPLLIFTSYKISAKSQLILNENIAWSLIFNLSAIMMLHSLFLMYWRRVYLDEMTALPNRRALDERVEALGRNYAIAMIDVDHFKKFNDTYGHDQGDDVLKLVARTLESVLGDKVYRYGGEEFTAVFAGKTAKESKDLADEAREKLEKTKFTVRSQKTSNRKKSDRGQGGGKKISVTISIGISNVNSKATTPEKVIKLADTALYKAKKQGRNCVVIAA